MFEGVLKMRDTEISPLYLLLCWSRRSLCLLSKSKYSIDGFPNWAEVTNKRYRSVYKRWYGL